jgi:hypothetical protein
VGLELHTSFVASSAQVWRAVSPQEAGHKNDPLWCNVPNITFTAEILKLVSTQFLHAVDWIVTLQCSQGTQVFSSNIPFG